MKGCDKMLKINTKKLVFLAIMMALGIVLKSFLSIGNNSFRISLWNIPIFFAGIVGGPIYGGICALGADLIYGFCFSSYPFSAIMTLTCVVWGISGGLFFKKNIYQEEFSREKTKIYFTNAQITKSNPCGTREVLFQYYTISKFLMQLLQKRSKLP